MRGSGRTWWLIDGGVALAVAIFAWLTVTVWRAGMGDIAVYAGYAQAFWLHSPRFQRFPVEYPPLALIPFALTLLSRSDPTVPFGLGMALVTLGLYVGLARWSGRRAALIWIAYLLLGEQAMVMARFDIVPALLCVAALWAAERGQFGWAHALVALGVLVKVYPIFLLPVLMIAESRKLAHSNASARRLGQRGAEIPSLAKQTPDGLGEELRVWWKGTVASVRQWRAVMAPIARHLALSCGMIGGGIALVAWRSPGSALLPLTYAAHRPAQVESAVATVAWLGTWWHQPVQLVYSYGSVNWEGPVTEALLPWLLPALFAGCALVYWRQWRGKLSLPAASLAVLCVTLLTNRAFSTQYLIWVIPFAALAEGLDPAWIVLCLLQSLEDVSYPYAYLHYSAAEVAHFALAVALRNAVLLFITARLLIRDDNKRIMPQPTEAAYVPVGGVIGSNEVSITS